MLASAGAAHASALTLPAAARSMQLGVNSRKLVSEDYMTWPCLEVGLHFYAFDCSPRNAYPQFEDVLWVGFFSFLGLSARV